MGLGKECVAMGLVKGVGQSHRWLIGVGGEGSTLHALLGWGQAPEVLHWGAHASLDLCMRWERMWAFC